MRVRIKPEFQIQRINKLTAELEEIKNLPLEQLIRRPDEKSWAVAEVLKHMVLGQKAYKEKVEKQLSQAVEGEGAGEVQASAIPSFLIKRFPPREGKIRFKMKTMKQFQPVFDVQLIDETKMQEVLAEMERSLDELKRWVNTYRTQTVPMKKFNSAVGAMVRFNVPEACEFILCHNERHFQQIRNVRNQL